MTDKNRNDAESLPNKGKANANLPNLPKLGAAPQGLPLNRPVSVQNLPSLKAASIPALSPMPAVRIFVHVPPTDMRKHFDSLCALVTQAFGQDIRRGDYFLFLNRSRDRCKILYWDRDGLVIWAKRLECGRFQKPLAEENAISVEIDATTLAMILGGVDLATAKRRKRYAVGA